MGIVCNSKGNTAQGDLGFGIKVDQIITDVQIVVRKTEELH
jgi:hypothetical protein